MSETTDGLNTRDRITFLRKLRAVRAFRPEDHSARSCTRKGTVERMMSSSFDPETLNLLDETEEVYIETSCDAVSPEYRTIIWTVVVGGEVFVRSVRGRKGLWYQRISAHPEGALLVGDTRIPVHAAAATDGVTVDAVSDAFRSKYEEAWPGPTAGIVRSEVLPTTLKISPA